MHARDVLHQVIKAPIDDYTLRAVTSTAIGMLGTIPGGQLAATQIPQTISSLPIDLNQQILTALPIVPVTGMALVGLTLLKDRVVPVKGVTPFHPRDLLRKDKELPPEPIRSSLPGTLAIGAATTDLTYRIAKHTEEITTYNEYPWLFGMYQHRATVAQQLQQRNIGIPQISDVTYLLDPFDAIPRLAQVCTPISFIVGAGVYFFARSLARKPLKERVPEITVGGGALFAFANNMVTDFRGGIFFSAAAVITMPFIATALYGIEQVTSKVIESIREGVRSPRRGITILRDSIRRIEAPPVETTSDRLGNLFSEKKFQELFGQYSRLLEEDIPLHPLSRPWRETVWRLQRWYREAELRLFPHDPQQELHLALLEHLLRYEENKLLRLERAKAKALRTDKQGHHHPLRNEVLFLYGEATGAREESIELILEDEELEWKPLDKKSASTVITPPHDRQFLQGKIIAKKHESSDKDFIDDRRRAANIREELKKRKRNGTTPHYHTITSHEDGSYTMVMTVEKGTPLRESRTLEDHIEAARCVGIIHDTQESERGKRFLRREYLSRLQEGNTDKVWNRLSTAWNFLWNIIHENTIIRSQEQRERKDYLVWDNDSHGLNALKSSTNNTFVNEKRKIVFLDFPDKGIVPRAIELGKLLWSNDFLQEDKRYIRTIVEEYSKERRITKDLTEQALAAAPINYFHSLYFCERELVDPTMTRSYMSGALRALTIGEHEFSWPEDDCNSVKTIICETAKNASLL